MGVMTTSAYAHTAETLTAVVSDARQSLDQASQTVWAFKSRSDVLAATVELERTRSRLYALEAIAAVEIEDTDAAREEQGWASVPDFLTATMGGRRGCGGKFLRTARKLVGDRLKTWQALYDGAISPEHADVIVRIIDHLPVEVGLREAAEDLLLQEAAKLNATELEVAGNHLLEVLDPEGVAKREEKKLDKLERSAHLNRFLAIVDDGIGGVKIRGRGTVEDAAVIKAALQALSAPLPATDPDCGTEGRDERDHGARTWDALVETCQKALDAEVPPADHGMKPRVVVLVGWEDLKARVGTATLETGEELSVAAVRRLACDAEVLPITLDGNGVPLDVGRANRLVTMGIWLALIARDRHCAFPGCIRPPITCDAHHVEHWIDGGKTSVTNMVLLCKAHHTIIHAAPWEVRINPHDHKPEFKPPPGRHALKPDFAARLDFTDGWVREREPRA
jgi:hypothetical protein